MMIMDDFFYICLVIFNFVVAIVVFSILFMISKYAVNKIQSSESFKSSRIFHLEEYFPVEETTEIKQIFYLAMIVLFALNFLYLFIYWRDMTYTLVIMDIVLSIYLTINVEESSRKYKWILLLLLLPFNSIEMVLFSNSFIYPFDILHGIVFIYFIKVYYKKFTDFTETNSLGITIMLLFLIVFISFIFTFIVEDVSPLDSLNMVSNAFTSNGYTVLGKSSVGKLNAILLVWSGFILSSVATATLTVAIVKKHIDDDFVRLEEMVKKNKKN